MPATPSLSNLVIGVSEVTIDATPGAGTAYVEFETNWTSGRDAYYVGNSTDTITASFPLPSGYGTFTILARSRTGDDASSWVSRGFSIAKPKPSPFSWTNTKSSEGIYNLTASEWQGFLNKINEFLAYKNGSTATFNTSITPGLINNYVVPSASSFNTARALILSMSPGVQPPDTVTSGQIITANQLNNMVTSLNSIS